MPLREYTSLTAKSYCTWQLSSRASCFGAQPLIIVNEIRPWALIKWPMKSSLKQALLKHDRLVPRYTSYPTAPHFKTNTDQEWYLTQLSGIPDGSEISLYVHIPFCPKLCWFCGCHTRVVNRYGPVDDYILLLQAELGMLIPHIANRNLRVSHLHFGGGSPTILKGSDFRVFVERLRNCFTFNSEAEIAIEIDPRNIDKDKVNAYARSGINRVSFGIQDFDQKVLEAVNRPQTYALDQRAIGMCRDVGIDRINIDLMYGLPYQNTDTMKSCIDKALSLSPDRVALFGYAHVPWLKKHMRLIPEESLPDAAQRIDLFETAAERFEDAGYIPVGIDHFATPEDSLTRALADNRLNRSFQGYTDDNAPYLIAFGASAISHLGGTYSQNLTYLPQYRERVQSGLFPVEKNCLLSLEDKLHARIIKNLMCQLSVNPFDEARSLGMPDYDFEGAYEYLHELAKDDLIRITADGTIHALARQATRLACSCFDTRLAASTQRRHVSSA